MVRWLTCLFFFGLYVVTLSRGVLSADNGEFQLVSTTLSLAHPPGFPLYTLIAHLFTKLPLPLSPAVKVNLFSAVTSTLTLSVVFSTISLTTTRTIHKERSHPSSLRVPPWTIFSPKQQLAALIGTATLGVATTFWAQATTANIRSLTALFAAVCLYCLIRMDSRLRGNDNTIRGNNAIGDNIIEGGKWTLLFAIAFGFGFTHHLSLAFMGLVMVMWVIWRDWRCWWKLSVGLVGLVPLIYLPIIEPNLRNPAEFINYALGLGFGSDFFFFITPAQLWLRAGVMWNVLTFQFHPILLTIALIGLVWLIWQRRAVGLLLGAAFLIHTFITATYRAPQTVEYMLPAYIPIAICVGVGTFSILSLARSYALRLGNQAVIPAYAGIHLLTKLPAFLLICLIIWQGVSRFPSFWWLRDEDVTVDYAKGILANAPPNATVLSNWHWFTPLRYLQEIDGSRPDLAVEFVFPQGETAAEKWTTAIEEVEGEVVATDFHGGAIPRPLGTAFLYNGWPPLENFSPLNTQLGATVQLLGVQISASEVAVGEEVSVTLVWEPMSKLPAMNLFVHLIDVESGQLFAQDDVPAIVQPDGFSVTQLRLTPRLGAIPSSYQILVGGYLADGTPLLDEDNQPRTSVTTLEVTPTEWRPYTRNRVWFGAKNERGDRLVGYDFDVTQTPRLYLHWQSADGYYSTIQDIDQATIGGRTLTVQQTHYVPLGHGIVWLGGNGVEGEDFVSVQTFAANRPITRDLRIGIRFVGYDQNATTWMWRTQNDSVPATGAIPTLKWIAGSKVRDPHPLEIGKPNFDGQSVAAWLTVYDAFTNRPIPILDERITAQGVGIPLGANTIQR